MYSTALQHRRHAKVTGGFFITATVAAIIGLKLYDPVLLRDDYLVQGAEHSQRIMLGAFFELVLAVANIGTAVCLYPYLRKYNESCGLAYVCFRVLEVVFILAGILAMLSLLSLSQAVAGAPAAVEEYLPVGGVLRTLYRWAFLLGPNFMLGINTFVYSYVFFRSRQLPAALSSLGITGAILIFAAALLQMFGVVKQLSPIHLLLSMPVAVYEMVLAGWLIVKGFKQTEVEDVQVDVMMR